MTTGGERTCFRLNCFHLICRTVCSFGQKFKIFHITAAKKSGKEMQKCCQHPPGDNEQDIANLRLLRIHLVQSFVPFTVGNKILKIDLLTI